MARTNTGRDAVLCINASCDQNAPVWVECGIIQDLNKNAQPEKVEFPCRDGGKYKQYVVGQIDLEVTFDVCHRTNDQCWQLFCDAVFNCEPIHAYILDGDPTESGTEGCEGTFYFFGFDQSQPLNEGLVDSVTLAPSACGLKGEDPIVPTRIQVA